MDAGNTEVRRGLHPGSLSARPGGDATAGHDRAAVPGRLESWPVGP